MAKLYLEGEKPVDDLLKEIDEIFPHQHFGPTDSIESIMYVSGQRSVVEYLFNKYNQED